MNLVEDNMILLAGATGRVGGATLATLVREGARVAVLSRDRERAQATIADVLDPALRERALAIRRRRRRLRSASRRSDASTRW